MKRQIAANQRKPLLPDEAGKAAVAAGNVKDAARTHSIPLCRDAQQPFDDLLLSGVNNPLVQAPVSPPLVVLDFVFLKRDIS